MGAPTLTQRQPLTSVVVARQQQLFPNVLLLQFLTDKWSLKDFRPQFKGRGSWFDGSAQNQIICRPVTHGISRRNIMTLGAGLHRRDPVIAVHIFARDPNACDQMREEVDRIIRANLVNPMLGISEISPADIPCTVGDYEEKDGSGVTLFHDIYYVRLLYYEQNS